MKKLALLTAIALLTVSSLVGCSPKEVKEPTDSKSSVSESGSSTAAQDQEDKPNVRVWIKKSFSEAADNALAERLKEFGTSTGKCTVEVEFIPKQILVKNTQQQWNQGRFLTWRS